MADKKEMTNKEYREKINEMNKEINERIKSLSAQGYSRNFIETQKQKFSRITGNVNEEKIAKGNISKFKKSKLIDVYEASKQFLKSRESTVEQVELANTRRRETIRLTTGYELTDDQFNAFTTLMQDTNIQYLADSRQMASEQIIKLVSWTEDFTNNQVRTILDVLANEINFSNMNNLSAGQIQSFLRTIILNENFRETDAYAFLRKEN